jgi:hypothetical protein
VFCDDEIDGIIPILQMNKVKLKQQLILLRIDPDSYCLNGGFPNEALCLEDIYGKWSIYYSEKGLRTEQVFYKNENEACNAFLVRLKEMLGI